MRIARCSWGLALTVVAGLTVAGCTDASGPLDIFVITFDPDTHDFELQSKRVETLDSVAKARGSTTRIIKEPAVRVTDDGDVRFEGGDPPNILFTESNGNIIPEDWDSLTLLSYYHHLERAVSYFHDTIGYTETDEIVPLPSYYRLEFGIDQNVVGATDNAAYAPTAHSFLLFDAFFFQELPLAMNDGVVTHEFSHAVFHRVMNGSERLPIEYRDGWSPGAVSAIASVHEGQADIFAGMMFDDPNFFRFSLPADVADRDMSVLRTLTEAQDHNLTIGSAEPHEIGAVIAAAVWAFSDGAGRERTAQLTFQATQDLAPELNGSFEIADFLVAFADACTPTEKTAACTLFCDRFLVIKDRISTCACP
jgi:hypothetical protein